MKLISEIALLEFFHERGFGVRDIPYDKRVDYFIEYVIYSYKVFIRGSDVTKSHLYHSHEVSMLLSYQFDMEEKLCSLIN